MKLVTYFKEEQEQLALLVNNNLYDTDLLHADLPISMAMFLNYWEDCYPIALAAEQKIVEGMVRSGLAVPYNGVKILAPVPNPTSCRNAFAFRQHAAATKHNCNAAMISQFDLHPAFYFANHNSIQGPGDIICMPDHFEKLDFGLEAAVVINKFGRNISAAEADGYIAGLMIMNDISTRALQMEEMLLTSGPAKANDFATAMGPMLVTLDELEAFEISCKQNHTGKAWNLPMSCSVNGVKVSSGNLGDMDWTFAEIIERCSYGVNLFPGDVIGSGPVGTGCFLELNSIGRTDNASHPEQWLKEGDEITMEIEGLGIMSNTIVKDESDYSLFHVKKFN